jgi:hypothetical protein
MPQPRVANGAERHKGGLKSGTQKKGERAGHRHDELPPLCVFPPLRESYFPFLTHSLPKNAYAGLAEA